MFVRIIICFSFMLSRAHSTLLQSPQDTEAIVGENVTLKCRTDVNGSSNPVEWRYKTVHRDGFEIVYKWKQILGRFKDRCEVVPNKATGQYDLVIKHVQLNDAGRYTCRDNGDDTHDAELIVLGKLASTTSSTTTSSTTTSSTTTSSPTTSSTTTSSTTKSSTTTSSPETIAPPEPMISSPGITSPEIYIPVSIISFVILISSILLVVRVFRRSLCVCSERRNDNCYKNDVEIGKSNNIELTHPNGTKSQEADVMLTRNTQRCAEHL